METGMSKIGSVGQQSRDPGELPVPRQSAGLPAVQSSALLLPLFGETGFLFSLGI